MRTSALYPLIFSTAVVCLGAGVEARHPRRPNPLRMTPVVIAVRKVSPAVINVFTTRTIRENPFGIQSQWNSDPYYQTRKVTSLGSGVIIDPRGYAVTNEHVLSRATKIKVQLSDNRVFTARVIGADRRFDLAVLQIQTGHRLPSVTMGTSSDLMSGEPVIAIGNPFGLSHTVSVGVISALHRRLKIRNHVYEDFIQTDAAINPGNSGGPLLNILGQLIGINTAIHKGGSGIGFAIPIDRVKQAVRDLLRFGHVRGGYLGMSVTPYQGPGLVVTSVVSGGPAARAGIHVRDVVLGIRGKAINATQDFTDAVAHMIPGERVAFQLQNRIARITIGAYTAPIAWRQFQLRLGIRVGNAATLATRYHLSVTRGIVLTWVKRSGVAWRVGLRAGDVILRINRKLTANTAQLYRLAPIFRLGTTLVMIVQRKTALYRATVPY
ncbi:MAG: trypsin-like peptidase domain-containing protein [Deltaproteobacteria bacterium]|nr:trypsin-like peptidase domain-containing protein [Deltaproteobacteria bacterium]